MGLKVLRAGMLLALGVLILGAERASAHPAYKVLYSFCSDLACRDGSSPQAPVILDADGNVFGTTLSGGDLGYGTVYEITRKGQHRLVHDFCCQDGKTLTGALVMDVDGNLYGTATNGGASKFGTVFRLKPNAHRTKWKFSLLHTFCRMAQCKDGKQPLASLTYAGQTSGALYDGSSALFGVAGGGANSGGVAFSLTPVPGKSKFKYKTIYSFCARLECQDGQDPDGTMTMDQAGNLYGVTGIGGANGSGVLYELVRGEKGYSNVVLHEFCAAADCTDGRLPEGPLSWDAAGNLYGTVGGGAHGFGGVYKLALAGSQYSLLYSFCSQANCADGEGPVGGVIVDGAGDLYGTTGVTPSTEGLVYKLHDGTLSVLHAFTEPGDGAEPIAGLTFGLSGELFGTTWSGGANTLGGTVFELTP